MKSLLSLLLLSFFVVSCASSANQENKVHPDFVPYVFNYIQNVNSKSTPDIKTGKEMSIQFDETNYAGSYAAYCKMNPDINKRRIFISKKYWRIAEKQRAEYITSVLIACGYKGSSKDYGEQYVRAFSNWQ